jgi:Holliday junction resolvase RusA-like endonuclease
MTEPVTVVLSGDPQGKGRPCAAVRGKFATLYTPAKTRTYEGMIRTAAMDVMAGREPISVPVGVDMTAVFAVPPSWSAKKRAAALAGLVLPAKKPDADNILKAWKDSLNGVVYMDDCQVVKGSFEKRYGPTPFVEVKVTPLVPAGK